MSTTSTESRSAARAASTALAETVSAFFVRAAAITSDDSSPSTLRLSRGGDEPVTAVRQDGSMPPEEDTAPQTEARPADRVRAAGRGAARAAAASGRGARKVGAATGAAAGYTFRQARRATHA